MKEKVQKYSLNKIKSNKSSTFYLYEVWAIPKRIRLKYLAKLLKRKGAEKNKNVLLLKYIYKLVDEENFHEWNLRSACDICGFKTANQLYWYKGKILKDLRELYFNWKDYEQEIESKSPDKNIVLYEKSIKMIEIGMIKEAKIILQKLLNSWKRRRQYPDKLILAKVYFYLSTYYYSRDSKKFLVYYVSLKKLIKKMKGSSEQIDKAIKVKILLLRLKAIKLSFKSLKNLNPIIQINILKEALSLSYKVNDISSQLELLYQIGETLALNISKTHEGLSQARHYLKKGLTLSNLTGNNDYAINFQSKLADLRKINQISKTEKYDKIMIKNYEKIDDKAPASIAKLRALDTLTFSTSRNSDEYNKYLKKLIKLNILRSQTRNAFFHLYFNYQFPEELSLFNLYYKEISGKKIPYVKNINEKILDKLNFTFETGKKELNSSHNSIIKLHTIIDLILYEFLRGKYFNFDKVSTLLKKYDLYKKRNLFSNTEIINHLEFLKISLAMFEESRKYGIKYFILDKYLEKFNNICNTIMLEKPISFEITDKYLLITFVANQLDYSPLWNIAYKFWNLLVENYPENINYFSEKITASEQKAS